MASLTRSLSTSPSIQPTPCSTRRPPRIAPSEPLVWTLSFHPSTQKVSANAKVYQQSYERQKLRRDGDRSEGDTIIGELLSGGHVLIPFAVDGYGGLGPMARQFVYGKRPCWALTFRRDRTNANRMYARASVPPAPHNIVPLASIRWKQNQTWAFYRKSETVPTPHEYLLQQLGLCFTKAFAIHLWNSYQKLMRRHSHTHSHSYNHAPPATADPS
ncbi:hypothetical protein THAOC_04439 [Thalassiosira oceanica]|uniref:Uncharacterized protein n=1 Tax=Thalassiosira oceanica TaxID=159749 RepID=K0T9Y2_THAOC|nr:hypothetical protein THAOC_04439 [Thalassiosira oceanica]|eukprot:EJK73914.1 hypothetical protein THAOC_04439 [Thalassiosira oceanica]